VKDNININAITLLITPENSGLNSGESLPDLIRIYLSNDNFIIPHSPMMYIFSREIFQTRQLIKAIKAHKPISKKQTRIFTKNNNIRF
jgi:hypothetical protein